MVATKRTYTRDTLLQWSRNLEKHMTNVTDLMDTREASADNQVAVALEDWSRAMTSRTLWIRGHDEHAYPSSTSRIASTVATRALQMGVPILGFFCDCRDPREDPENDIFLSREDRKAFRESVVINFAYSLIRQAISLLPNRIETRIRFSKSAFAKLDGTLASWEDAVHILKKLLKLTPQAILVVVDGIEQLDQSGLEKYVDNILELLLSYVSEEESIVTRIFKILFTTAGTCSMLEKLDDLEMVAPSQARSRRVHGRGRRFLEIAF